MDPDEISGPIVGAIASFLLLAPAFWYLLGGMEPRSPSNYGYVPGWAGIFILYILVGGNMLGLLFAGITKNLLKRSRAFESIFILSGILNFWALTSMVFRVSVWWGTLLLYIPSILTILLGVSFIEPLRRLVFRQNNE